MDITNDTVTEVAVRLSRGERQGETDSVSVQHWLLFFGVMSGEVQLIVADFAEWLGNKRPPWDAYRALMSGRLIALDKQSGVRQVGVGKTWRWLMVKCVLWLTGQEAMAACRTEHLDGGVESGIEEEIHAMRLLWEQHY